MLGAGTAAAAQPYFTQLPAAGNSELKPARAASPIAATLPNGKVLLAGGTDGSNELQSAELFDPASDTFTALPASGNTELQTAREYAAAAPLPDGKVLIVGGDNGSSSALQSAELFDPSTNTFSELPASGSTELQTARDAPVAAPLPGGKVLIAGGDQSTNRRTAEIFDSANHTFTALPALGNSEMTTGRDDAVAAPLPDGRVLIAGGIDPSGHDVQTAEIFDPANDTFTQLAASGNTELPTPRSDAQAAELPNGQVLIAGGQDQNGTLQQAVLFDPASDTFTALPSSGSTELQTPRNDSAAALMHDGRVLIAGGYDNSGRLLATAELFGAPPQATAPGGDFGQVRVGRSATKTVTVTNTGAQALAVSGASVGAAGDPGDFAVVTDGCAGKTLTHGQSCTVDMRFRPSAAGARTATLDLSGNGPTPETVALSGTGVKATLIAKIKKAKVRRSKGRATFVFKAAGGSLFQCALVRHAKHKRPRPRFTSCRSPKTYKHLRHGRYTFWVRAIGAGGAGAAATRSFRIG